MTVTLSTQQSEGYSPLYTEVQGICFFGIGVCFYALSGAKKVLDYLDSRRIGLDLDNSGSLFYGELFTAHSFKRLGNAFIVDAIKKTAPSISVITTVACAAYLMQDQNNNDT